jgi:hypothetical protein
MRREGEGRWEDPVVLRAKHYLRIFGGMERSDIPTGSLSCSEERWEG